MIDYAIVLVSIFVCWFLACKGFFWAVNARHMKIRNKAIDEIKRELFEDLETEVNK